MAKQTQHLQVNFEALFEYATEGMLVADNNGVIVLANPAAAALFGYVPEEIIGQPVEILLPTHLAARHACHRNRFHQSPHPRQMGIGMDLFGRKKDGSEFPIEISLSPFKTEEGEFVIAFIVDITIRKQSQNALLQQKKELEELARALKVSNEDLENFAYVSSHDLQEPLRKIRSFSDMLQSNEAARLSGEGIDYLLRIQNAAARMQTLIQDLLAFSRLTSRAKGFEKVNLNRMVQEVLTDLEIAVSKSGARIDVGELPSIEAEPTQMRQLFQNLLSNALKFQKENTTPEISIRQQPSAQGEQYVDVVVADNGIGFDEKYREKIFTIFQRLEGKKYEGTGIGLAICRKIALRHGGNIIAHSKPGEGATFIITLALKPLRQDILYQTG